MKRRRYDKTKQVWIILDKTDEDKAGFYKEMQDRTGQDRTREDTTDRAR